MIQNSSYRNDVMAPFTILFLFIRVYGLIIGVREVGIVTQGGAQNQKAETICSQFSRPYRHVLYGRGEAGECGKENQSHQELV